MVARSAPPGWGPSRFWRQLHYLFRRPGDLLLSLRLAHFIWGAPRWLERMPLPELLQHLRTASRPSASNWRASYERINRLSRPWFRLPGLRHHNTCYLRALMYYRFLDTVGEPMQIHFVVEPPRSAEDRIRGHAWVTAGNEMIEPPPEAVVARTQSLYRHPPAEE